MARAVVHGESRPVAGGPASSLPPTSSCADDRVGTAHAGADWALCGLWRPQAGRDLRRRRLFGLPVAAPLHDPRVAAAHWAFEGNDRSALGRVQAAFGTLGLVGVIAAGFEAGVSGTGWIISGGFADLETGEALLPGRAMLAGSITKLLTATLTLRLVGEGLVALDDSANRYLSSLRLASDAATIRQLLTHTAGVSSDLEHFVEEVPPAARLLGHEVAIDFSAGTQHRYSNGGYAVLGELISHVRGSPYSEIVDWELFRPLGMTESAILTRWRDDAPKGYIIRDGSAFLADAKVPSVPAAGGLYTTAADLGRFLAGWRSLLPDDLAAAAVSPQVAIPGGGWQGYGWRVSNEAGETLLRHGGGVLGFRASLMWNTHERRIRGAGQQRKRRRRRSRPRPPGSRRSPVTSFVLEPDSMPEVRTGEREGESVVG